MGAEGAKMGKRNGPLAGAVDPAGSPPEGYGLDDTDQSASGQAEAERVVMYVDGFNLYHGMHSKFGRRFLWLDLVALGERLLLPEQKLVRVHYFTAAVRGGGDPARRQQVYLGALRAKGVLVTLGRFQDKTITCRACGTDHKTYEEKKSDVSLSVQLVEDAHLGSFDTAILVSADSDMSPAIAAVGRARPGARVVAAFPPDRTSGELEKRASASIRISRAALSQSQLPDRVQVVDRTYDRPMHWY